MCSESPCVRANIHGTRSCGRVRIAEFTAPDRLECAGGTIFRATRGSGAARIALEAGVPLVPAAIAGTDRLLALGPLRVAYGAPVEIDDLRTDDDRRRSSQEATERLMARITELEATL